MVAAMFYVAAIASFWPACSNIFPSAHAAEMATSAGPGGEPRLHHVTAGDHVTSDCGGLRDACLEIEWNKAEAAQYTNPPPMPLAASLPSGFDDALDISRMRRVSAAPFYTPPPPPAVSRSLLALKTLFRN